MKKIFVCFVVLACLVSSAFAANFSPTPMKISAAQTIKYDFGGATLTVPVTVTGVAGTGYFLVFTKDKASSIVNVKNGFMGWHYVNKIDTCLYISPPKSLVVGSNNIT